MLPLLTHRVFNARDAHTPHCMSHMMPKLRNDLATFELHVRMLIFFFNGQCHFNKIHRYILGGCGLFLCFPNPYCAVHNKSHCTTNHSFCFNQCVLTVSSQSFVYISEWRDNLIDGMSLPSVYILELSAPLPLCHCCVCV